MFLKPLLNVGTPAPHFAMLDQNGITRDLNDYLGKQNIVLVFYPADFTPVCTSQLCEFRDSYVQLQAQGIEVLAINLFNWETHQRFAQKNNLPFPVLFDPRGRFAKRYQLTIIPRYVIRRAVYGINKDGIICYAQPGKPAVADVLASFGAINTPTE